MITKGCPKCDMQVPVACKNCPCGHIFFTARRSAVQRPNQQQPADNAEGETAPRRTERVKREKPNYYDALEFENKTRKKPIRPQRSGASSTEEREESKVEEEEEEEEDDGDLKGGRGRRRLRRKQQPVEPREEEDEVDPTINLSPEKVLQYSIELAEINRKIASTSWKP